MGQVGSAKLFQGRIAFPLLAEAVAEARAACETGEPDALRAVESVEQVSGLEEAKRAPPQGKKAAGCAPKRAQPKPRVQQPRSFGGGLRKLAGGAPH